MPNGIVIIDKPQGWTSMDVCAKLRGILHEKRVGHAGTLDPMATGVLPVFVGQATKAVSFAEGGQKVYEAVLQLGLVTDTQDTTGETLEERAVTVTEDEVRAAQRDQVMAGVVGAQLAHAGPGQSFEVDHAGLRGSRQDRNRGRALRRPGWRSRPARPSAAIRRDDRPRR